ncbi:MAG: hypothetical protein M1431_04255 [Candidatus Thermoplasmatota archaeon]|nr:hypothetical protein [Candidatus Thermoplasmatota archaeon]
MDYLNGSIYERELSGILSGNETVIARLSKRLDETERSALASMVNKPFFVTRSAGSLGADLIALRHDFSMIIEVKSSINGTLMFTEASGQRQDQAMRLRDLCQRAGLFVVYAFRLKSASGDPWRIFTIPAKPEGRIRHLYEIIPNMGETKNGNFVMKWVEGLPLTKLLDYMNQEI